MKNHRKHFGFAIIEALVALVVVGFGMLALAGMQGALTRNVDTAQQRTEATRLAQEKMESLRSFTGIDATAITASSPSSGVNWNSFNNGSDTINDYSNATYTRSWFFGGDNDDAVRSLTVSVTWTDRTGDNQSVTLNSFISKTDPADSGFLGFPLPDDANLKLPKNRNLNIPYPAVTLSDKTKSAFKPAGSEIVYVFDNLTGNIVCDSGDTNPDIYEGIDIDDINDACDNASIRYMLTGYVNFDLSNNPSSENPDNTDTSLALMPWTSTSGPLSSTYTGTTTCYSERQKVVEADSAEPVGISTIGVSGDTVTVVTSENHGFITGHTVAIKGSNLTDFSGIFIITVPEDSLNSFTYQLGHTASAVSSPSGTASLVQRITIAENIDLDGYTTIISRFVSYVCVIDPALNDDDTAVGETWGGKVTLNLTNYPYSSSSPSLLITDKKVCRYSADYNGGGISNSEHPLFYGNVTGALVNQNFLVIKSTKQCPSSTAEYANYATVLHQPSGIATLGEDEDPSNNTMY